VRGADPLRQKRAHAQRPASRADRRLDPRIWLHQPSAEQEAKRATGRNEWFHAVPQFGRPRRASSSLRIFSRSALMVAKSSAARGRLAMFSSPVMLLLLIAAASPSRNDPPCSYYSRLRASRRGKTRGSKGEICGRANTGSLQARRVSLTKRSGKGLKSPKCEECITGVM
jgi:hypothetical protein